MIFTGNCAIEDMGLKPFGFGGGREDIWEPEEDVNWGYEDKWLSDEKRYSGTELGSKDARESLSSNLGAVQMGLI